MKADRRAWGAGRGDQMARINEREIRNHPKGLHEKGRRGFLARLRDDTRGNVLAIATAAIIPLLCLIGSGIDLSRAYAAQSRLQVACDAAALAGRRAMSAGVVDSTVTTEAEKFFNFNFPQGSFDTDHFTLSTKAKDGTEKGKTTVLVSAQTRIPTSIMKIFGFEYLPLSVTCDARQDFVNTDVMLVLDVTKSMDENLGGSPKIAALREAVMALYDELAPVQDQLKKAGLQLRYGIVPYSSNVNVGNVVRGINNSYVESDKWTYHSRKLTYKHTKAVNNQSDCNAIPAEYRSYSNKQCTYYDSDSTGNQSTWIYMPVEYDIANFVKGNEVDVPSRDSGTTKKAKWAGCIEEAQTTSSITTSSDYTIPSGAHDLDLDLIPNSKETRWKPFWPEVTYLRAAGTSADINGEYLPRKGTPTTPENAYTACPSEARRLTAWSRDDLKAYIDNLVTTGGTYHDIGLIWGGRLLSRKGVFKSDNPEQVGSMPVSRFLIFLTDGALAPNVDSYSAYGIEQLDRKITGTANTSTQTSRHEQRFKMVCHAIKGQSVSIWVISFTSTDPSAALKECASSPNQVSKSSDKAQLIAKFVEIGKNIGSLRLTQ